MLKIIFAISLFFSFLNADILKLTKYEKAYIKTLPDKKVIAKRFSNFYKFLNKARSYNLEKKLQRTNQQLNKILPRNERTNNWSSPKKFLINGYGDCEDYVIAKYFTLLELGLDKSRFYFSVVKVKGSLNYHMVLVYLNDNNEALVLDNLSWKVLPLEQRETLSFKYAFNELGSFDLVDGQFKKDNIRRNEVIVLRKFVKAY